MLLGFLTILVMLAIAYAHLRGGLMTSFMMCVNVFAAGLVTFNFYEPLADALDLMFTGTFLKGYEDAICMVGLFGVVLVPLRVTANSLCSSVTQFPLWLQFGGGIFFSMVTGYLTSGFLIAVLQTLPLHHEFMWFNYRIEPDDASAVVRRVMPPDRVWLALMRRAGAYSFSNNEDRKVKDPDLFADRFTAQYITFDKYATFELRYARYRRTDKNRDPRTRTDSDTLRYDGECDAEVHKPR